MNEGIESNEESVSAFGYFSRVIAKYAVFDGRARRKEYWYFVLFVVLISLGLSFIDVALGLYNEEAGWGLLGGLFTLFILLPSIAVTIRRLHDTSRSGWWVILAFIPLLNLIILVFMVLDGSPGENQYGPNPKGVELVEQGL